MELEEFARRRRRLMELVGRGSIAILPTAVERIRNRDVHYPFRPDSDFYYLTGFPEPEAVAVFVPGRAQGEFVLFCRERDPERETWDGRRAGLEGACASFGADDAFPIADLDDILPGLLENRDRIFYTMGFDPEFDQRVLGWLNRVRGKARQGVNAPEEFVTLAHVIHELRLYKGRAEVRTMRRAAEIAAEGHRQAMLCCRPGMYEYQIEAVLNHSFTQAGSRAPAYPAIVGGGVNGCILHYRENESVLQDGDLLLIDAGAEYECYASDITRTFPVNGRYSELQREVYELVLEAQLAAIDKCRAGNHWDDPHQAAVKVLTKGLVGLGLLKGRVPTLVKQEAYKPYYMHRTGHWLGMDVHDVGDYKVGGQWRLLEAGMVMTVEPGLYFIPGTKGLPKRLAGIGIRIEDDVLVTRGEPDVLSRGAPKAVAEIEALMATGAAAIAA
jgi:Xaa-Pro aminopeptidase